jgi:pre-mRNA-splicing factor SYF1
MELHERALLTMFNMPRIWLDYAQFSAKCMQITKTRKIFDGALQALPVTQHSMIWEAYVQWAVGIDAGTAISVYHRFSKMKPEVLEELISYLLA